MRCSPEIGLRKLIRVKGIYEYESIYFVILYYNAFTSNLAAFHAVIWYAKTIRVVSWSTREVCENLRRHETGAVVCGRVRGIVIAVSWWVGARGEEDVCCFYLKNFFSIQCK